LQGTFHQYYLTRTLTTKHSHTTYLASPINDPERQVHLTVFAASLCPFPHDREKLLQKAQEIQALEHPYLLPILDLGIEEGQPFVAREYLPQASLHSHLLNLHPEPLELRAALTIVLQVGEALAYAHTRRVLHRNLKPSNILFDAHGHALLTDFSLVTGTDAIIRDQVTEEDAFCYLAPEQLAGTCDARSDQYALGCLTYELITGQVPFVGQRLASLMAHPSQAGPLPPSERFADLPSSLEVAVLKTLAKDPAERFVDCSLFLDVIRSVLFETVSESPVPTSERSIPPRLPKEESADVWLAPTSLEEQEALSLMSAPASPVHESSASTHGWTTPWLASLSDQPEPRTRQAAGSKRRPIMLALVLSVALASITSAFWLSGSTKPETRAHLSNQGTRQVLTEKNIPSKSPSMQTTTPSAQATNIAVVQSPVQTTPPPTTQSPAQTTPPPTTQPPAQATPPPTTQAPVPTPTPPPPSPASYEAEAPENTLANGAQILSCASCSGGYRVGYLGLRPNGTNGSLQFNKVNKASAGNYTLTVYYANGATYARDEYISINNGSSVIVFSESPTGSFSTFTTVQITVSLKAGNNTITFYNPQSYAPDIDKIII
jgi:serine/threonine protein kinase